MNQNVKSKTNISMIPDKILYTDGHDVTVTESTFQVRQTAYELRGITKFGLLIRRPDRLPGLITLLLGLLLLLVGLMNFISPSMIADVRIGDALVTANTIAFWLGVTLIVLGVVFMIAVRERYSVRIATAEGEKDAVVSSKKEYISQIVDALNRAVNYLQYNSTGTRYLNSIK
jgi:hypothetical protein